MNYLKLYSKQLSFLLKLFGTNTNSSNQNVNFILVSFNLFILILFTYGAINAVSGLSNSTEPIYLSFIFIYTVATYIILLLKRNKIHHLIEVLDNSFYFEGENVLSVKTTIHCREVKLSVILGQAYNISIQLAIVAKLISSLVRQDRVLLFDVKFPILGTDMKSGYLYYLMMMMQFISFEICTLVHVTGMYLFMGISNIMSGQIEIMCIAYENMHKTVVEKRGRISMNHKMGQFLKENIRHHQVLLKFFSDFNSIFGWIFTEMYVAWQLLICFIVFQTFQGIKTNNGSFINNITLLLATFAQTILYLWSGDRVSTKSKKIKDSVYASMWYNQEDSFKTSLRIVLECSKKPMLIAAILLVPANRVTFRQIMGSAFSYYNILVALSGE